MFVTPLFKLMAEKQASDLFFTAGAPIQIKINGVLMPINSQVLDAEQVKKICYELMSEAQIKEFETLQEMNFAQSGGELGNFRVNIFRQKSTVAMVIRFVKPDVPPIESLGLPLILKEIIMEKLGLILVVGSTGSGKSTTMASMIDYRNSTRTGHILTIEDPIEFVFKHKKSIVNQREVRVDTHSYQNALISAMREAPDLLMIGEIRDQPTLQSALLFAQTGHLCMSTLHANNSYNALNRIINFFPREAREALLADLSIALRAVISQRLVRTHGRQARTGGRGAAQHQAHPGADQERRDGPDQGSPGAEPLARLADLRAGAVLPHQQRQGDGRRGDGALRLAHQSALAAQQRAQEHRPGRNAQPAGSTTKQPDDISSIKLNLDALG